MLFLLSSLIIFCGFCFKLSTSDCMTRNERTDGKFENIGKKRLQSTGGLVPATSSNE